MNLGGLSCFVICRLATDLQDFLTLFFIFFCNPEPTGGDGNLALTLDICDLIEVLYSSSTPQNFPTMPQVTTNTSQILKNYKEDLLASFFFQGRQKRQAQVGYNVNSFGLRFGKRATKLKNRNSLKPQFGSKNQFSIPLNALRHAFCVE
ncbi:hypothetical protein XENTR_v10019341 [Xenopus tropicalis]|uniref:Kisspeptin n=1 Tax=Xenopus tropicalis TaxID=8364 RepID=C6F3U0_XENTR|nr:kisspeptin [Xenopus tropicalis]ACJ50539.1 kisspeptin isoform 1b [Xenopus tropicalis]KAE8593838.1 hypothetical protein XENTR_v10019341 [Xenopus tropicalis]|eukprot:NP_001163986.1 kisspeptin [Xenopus tropicalis]